jgi:hypothetical protein
MAAEDDELVVWFRSMPPALQRVCMLLGEQARALFPAGWPDLTDDALLQQVKTPEILAAWDAALAEESVKDWYRTQQREVD